MTLAGVASTPPGFLVPTSNALRWMCSSSRFPVSARRHGVIPSGEPRSNVGQFKRCSEGIPTNQQPAAIQRRRPITSPISITPGTRSG